MEPEVWMSWRRPLPQPEAPKERGKGVKFRIAVDPGFVFRFFLNMEGWNPTQL